MRCAHERNGAVLGGSSRVASRRIESSRLESGWVGPGGDWTSRRHGRVMWMLGRKGEMPGCGCLLKALPSRIGDLKETSQRVLEGDESPPPRAGMVVG
jgi:hypothetical protein